MRLIASLLLTFALALPACAQQAAQPNFELGKHYYAIDPVQPTSSGDKIEVLAVFMYTCPHCYDLEPYLVKWAETKGADVAYAPFPAAWNPSAEAFARGFYAAETLGVMEKTHEAMFAAVHKERVAFRTLDDIANWYVEKGGVSKEQFMSAANSFAVNSKIGRSNAMIPRWGVAGTPAVVVNGKYRFDVGSAGGHVNVAPLIDFLVAKERAAKGG